MKAVNISELKAIPIEIPKKYDQESFLAGAGEVLNRLYKLEEKDVEPVKHGEWEEKEVFNVSESKIDEWQSARCSQCGLYHTTPYLYFFDDFRYCPNCGALMIKGERGK